MTRTHADASLVIDKISKQGTNILLHFANISTFLFHELSIIVDFSDANIISGQIERLLLARNFFQMHSHVFLMSES